jgi:hypothetical protein
MFDFIDFRSTSISFAQDKGKLFERLVKDLIDACGFRDIELRAKISSMEYDITANQKLGLTPLVGEAKAHIKKIDGDTIASFVGKMYPIWTNNPKTLGLFISTSEFTPDANDYLRTVKSTGGNLRTIVGQEILDLVSKEKSYPTTAQIKARASKEFAARPGDTLFLVSDRGDFFIQLLIRTDETRPRAFCVYHCDGSNIHEQDFGNQLRSRIPELGELLFWPSEMKRKSFLDSANNLMAPIEGTGWFDFRFPAPPECFIGRLSQVNTFVSFVNRSKAKKTSVSVYQVLSRSGVGKSSFLLKLQNEIGRIGVICTITDARNFRSTIDLLDLVQEYIGTLNRSHDPKVPTPDSFENALSCIEQVSQVLRKSGEIGFIFIDQFESLFAKPDLYAAFIDLLSGISHSCDNIFFCIARKNDQPTTYDERAKIDLEYLREVSETVLLEDFSRDEALGLIEHIQDEIEQPLLEKLKEMMLEFSQGFPWLHKRICAHVVSMIKKGTSQEELVQAGLKPDELFKEELADLDEVEADFLRRLAQYLPATIEELSEVFPEGNVLSKRVSSFQHHRLIRLTGRTYDTYNDVLKEYLKTGRVPFAVKYVFRVGPIVTLNLLNRIQSHGWKTIADIREKERKSTGSVLNRLRELRLLGLIDYSKGNIRLPETTIGAYQDGTILQLLQSRVRQNGLVKDVLDRLAVSERITYGELKSLFEASMPLLDISEETWETYTKILSRWLHRTSLVSLSNKGLSPSMGKISISQQDLDRGNLSRGYLPPEYYLPSAYVNELFSCLDEIGKPTANRKACDSAALTDCFALSLIGKITDSSFALTPAGKRFLKDTSDAKEILKDFLLSKPNVTTYLGKVGQNPTSHVAVLKETIGNFVTWEEGTWSWRSKVLVNWLAYAELVRRKKGQVTSYPSRLF